MKSKKTKEDLINVALEQIVLDVHVGDQTAIEELLGFIPVENLVAYLPDEDHKGFYHLVTEEYLKKEEPEIRTENALVNLISTYHNDADLGREVRLRYSPFKK